MSAPSPWNGSIATKKTSNSNRRKRASFDAQVPVQARATLPRIRNCHFRTQALFSSWKLRHRLLLSSAAAQSEAGDYLPKNVWSSLISRFAGRLSQDRSMMKTQQPSDTRAFLSFPITPCAPRTANVSRKISGPIDRCSRCSRGCPAAVPRPRISGTEQRPP